VCVLLLRGAANSDKTRLSFFKSSCVYIPFIFVVFLLFLFVCVFYLFIYLLLTGTPGQDLRLGTIPATPEISPGNIYRFHKVVYTYVTWQYIYPLNEHTVL